MPDVTAPVLYVTATTDSVCPPDVIQEAVKITKRATQKVMECSHFEVYNGELFEEAVAAEVEFLEAQLLGGGGATASGANAAGGGARGGGEEARDEL